MEGNGVLIGAVAARSGLIRKALRLYEARGILPPPRRTASGYRVYADVLGLLRFVGQARTLGLTLGEIRAIVALRRAGTAPCMHVRTLLERKAADLEGMLGELRRILRAWPVENGRQAAVCPHIEAKGGETSWNGSPSPSVRRARPARAHAAEPGSGAAAHPGDSGRCDGAVLQEGAPAARRTGSSTSAGSTRRRTRTNDYSNRKDWASASNPWRPSSSSPGVPRSVRIFGQAVDTTRGEGQSAPPIADSWPVACPRSPTRPR